MKHKFYSIRLYVTKHDVTFVTKREFYPHPTPSGFATGRTELITSSQRQTQENCTNNTK